MTSPGDFLLRLGNFLVRFCNTIFMFLCSHLSAGAGIMNGFLLSVNIIADLCGFYKKKFGSNSHISHRHAYGTGRGRMGIQLGNGYDIMSKMLCI